MIIKMSITIKVKLIAAFLTLSIIPIIVVGGFSYFGGKSSVEGQIGTFSEQLIKQTTVNLNSKINEFQNVLEFVTTNSEFNTIINKTKESYKDVLEESKDEKKVTDTLGAILTTNSDIKRAIFLSPKYNRFYGDDVPSVQDGDNYYTSAEFKNTDFYKKIVENKGKMVWFTGFKNSYDEILLGIGTVNPSNQQLSSILILGIKASCFEKIVNEIKLGNNAKLSILNSEKKAICSSITGNIGKEITENYAKNVLIAKGSGKFLTGNKLVVYGTCSNGWKLLSDISVNSLMSNIYIVGFWTIIIGILCAILALGISIVISQSITNPINDMIRLMKKAECGDLTVRSQFKSKNEMGRLLTSFNLMIENINYLVKEAREVTKNILSDSVIIKDVSEQYSTSAEQVSCAMGEIAKGTCEQVSGAEKATDIIFQMSAKLENLIDNIQGVMDATNNAERIGKDAKVTVENLNSKTKESLSMVKTIQDNIYGLNNSTTEIIKIIDIMSSINEKTQLLSLNAAIEAARAGTLGSAFGVVAEEVRKLSLETKAATKLIKALVDNIENQGRLTITAVKSSNEIFKDQKDCVDATDGSFKKILSSMEYIRGQVKDVKLLIGDINLFEAKVKETITSILQVTEDQSSAGQEVLASSEQQAAAAEELAGLSNNFAKLVTILNRSIEKFII